MNRIVRRNLFSEGIKLIRQTGGTNIPDDPSMPWRLDANFSPPEFMSFAFVCLYGGSEEICVRGESKEVLEEFVEENHLRTHPRLRRLEITQPELMEQA